MRGIRELQSEQVALVEVDKGFWCWQRPGWTDLVSQFNLYISGIATLKVPFVLLLLLEIGLHYMKLEQ